MLGVTACLLFGCNQSKPPGDTEQKETTTQLATPRDQVAAVSPALKLTGVWLGEAMMDEAKFQQKLSLLSPEQQQLMLAKARSFMSMVMAIEFRNDGTIQNGVEIVSTDGQILRDSAVGKWKIVSAENNDLVVETRETLSDGTIVTDQNIYTFLPEGDRFAMAVPVSGELQGCNPMMVFAKKSLADANLAEGISETQSK
jgi:hypothetical protein